MAKNRPRCLRHLISLKTLICVCILPQFKDLVKADSSDFQDSKLVGAALVVSAFSCMQWIIKCLPEIWVSNKKVHPRENKPG
jgi:hypothetical protein